MKHNSKETIKEKRVFNIDNIMEIDWKEEFSFENPIEKTRIRTYPDAMEISRKLMNILDERTKALSLCVLCVENILASIIFYTAKYRHTIHANLGVITTISCTYDGERILMLLEEMEDAVMFGKSMRNSPTLFNEALVMMRLIMRRIYTKEYIRLFIVGGYDPAYYDDEECSSLFSSLPVTVSKWFNINCKENEEQ